MRTAIVSVTAGTTFDAVTQAQCPAAVVFSNKGTGTVYISNEGNANAAGAGVPLAPGGVMPWGITSRPLFAFGASDLLVTFLDPEDEITV